MTTTIAFASRDCLVVGCDSLAIDMETVIDLASFTDKYFDEHKQIKVDTDGKPILPNYQDVLKHTTKIPKNSDAYTTKLFNLEPANCALLFRGDATIGLESSSNLVDSLLSDRIMFKYLRGVYSISGIAKRIETFISKLSSEIYSKSGYVPFMEITVAGYSKRKNKPEIYEVIFEKDGSSKVNSQMQKEPHVLVIGGQDAEIRRLVIGLDEKSNTSFHRYVHIILAVYGKHIEKHLKEITGKDIKIPRYHDIKEMPALNTKWVSNIAIDLFNISEQTAINLVDFLIDTTIKSQEFSNSPPTVGGNIHIGLLTKRGGFRWISNEQYIHRDNQVSKYEIK